MNLQRWPQIDELFQAAVELDPALRAGFLEKACAGDHALRSEVEAMLASDSDEWEFVEKPALQVAAALLVDDQPQLAPGEGFGHYRVVDAIGRGGMGEVYLAQDERLGRKVALKLLLNEFTSDQSRLGRFQQEARAASALNHPNILTIHDIGEFDSRYFIASEFIDGETLRQRLSHQRMTIGEALDITIQIASALSVAHETGIVHRNIKPENIMLRHDGYVKVLDFGLAKLTEQHEPTTQAQAAENVKVSSGLVMGTVKYMSPEQARGQQVDGRSDIFSFGVVLYEMVAGCAPFEEQTAHELVASILKNDPPPLTQYSPQVPAELQRVVSKALRKTKEERYQSIDDLVSDLKGLKEKLELESKRIQTPWSAEYIISEIKRHRTAAAVIVAALFISAAVIAYLTNRFIRQSKSTGSSQNIKLTRVTTSGKARGAAISPDGKYLAYVASDTGQQSLWIRQLDTNSNMQIVPPSTATYMDLSFSPDGDFLYYFDERKDETALYQIPAVGGVPRKLLEGNGKHHLRFSPDGKRLAFVVEDLSESGVFVANADGTEERRLAARKSPAFFWAVDWSPDGKKIACAGGNKTGKRVYFDLVEVGIEDGAERPITSQGWSYIDDIAWLSDGSGLLMSASDQEGSTVQIWLLNPDGNAHRITTDLNGYSRLSLTADSGALVTTQISLPMNIWTQPNGEPDRARQITSGVATRDGLSGISWTPDGRIVYSSFASGNPDIWIMDPDGSNQKQLTVGLGSDRYGLSVSPDGRYILFVSFRAGNGNGNTWRVDIDGSNPKQLTNGSGVEINPFCSPDSKWVFYLTAGSRIRWKVPIDGGEPVQLTGLHSNILGFSPNGNLIAYLTSLDQTKIRKVGIASFEGGEPITVLDQVEHAPRMQWAPDGSALTYFGNRGGTSNIWSLPIDSGPPKQLTDFKTDLDIHCFAWSRDGKHLAVARGTTVSDIVLIKNFR